jgi:predicted transcriptional regulator
MDLHNVRESLHKVLKIRGMTREAFARKHKLSSSWLYKFAQGNVDNPRLRSLERLQKAIESESQTPISDGDALPTPASHTLHG